MPWLAGLAAMALALPAGGVCCAWRDQGRRRRGRTARCSWTPRRPTRWTTASRSTPARRSRSPTRRAAALHNVAFNDASARSRRTASSSTGLFIVPGADPAGPGVGSLPAPWTGECTFPAAGTYNFYCSVHAVHERLGRRGRGLQHAAHGDRGPHARRQTCRATRSVAFTATGADADGDTLTYNWDFGDGQSTPGQNPSHIYDAPGTYAARS